MTFSKKGLRRIVVENKAYYWQASEADYLQGGFFDPIIFHARPERESHQLLSVTCGRCNQQIPGFNGLVTPRIVRGCIESAIISGWPSRRPRLTLILFSEPPRYITMYPNWRTSTVIALATSIHSEKAFDRIPILADALQDAGCDNEHILNHCREIREHDTNCWVVDLVIRG